MKVGLVYPQTEYSSHPIAVRDYAQTAEDLGFTHILAYDHVLGANPDRPGGWDGPYTYQHSFQELFVLFSFLAGITTKLEFTSGIFILPQRQTALFAKQAACLDVLSTGRLRLGIGLGWNKVEYTSLNENFHNRGRRFEEQVDVLRKLWTQPLVTYQGRWHQIPDAGLNPLPVQRPIPLWFGGSADPVLERTARLADGWMPMYRRAVDAKPALEKIFSAMQACGRNPDELGIEPRLSYGDGNPDTWNTILSEWRAAGASHFSFNTMGSGFSTPQQHLAAIRRFAESLPIG
jgi:probable F420-dependent oxidoreductase